MQAVVEALEGLVDAHVARPTVAGLAQCDLFLKAPLRSVRCKCGCIAVNAGLALVSLCLCVTLLIQPLDSKLSEEGTPWASSPERKRLHEAVHRLQAAMEEVRKAWQQART